LAKAGWDRVPLIISIRTAAAAVAATFVCAPAAAGGATYPPGFEERTVVAGLHAPTGLAWTPDGRMFVIEKAGRLKVVPAGGSTAATILDISSEVNSYWDRGLLGIAVDSDYANNGYVYLLYTRERQPMTPDGDGQMVSRLERMNVSPSNVISGRTTVLGSHGGPCPTTAMNTADCIPSEGFSHSIGTVRSAPDGTLWVGSGDAASFNFVDPLAYRTYNPESMAGKIMHVDRNGQGLPGHPFCPTDNDLTHVCTKIWAGGFRNPFRFKLRPGGGLTVGDVGWGTTEEVDLIPTAPPGGGRLYGWPCYEGSGRTGGYRDRADCGPEYAKEGTPQAHVGPVHEYPHNGSDAAVLGGPTYTGGPFPSSYQGDVFFADYAQGVVKKLNLNGDQVTSVDNFASGWVGVDLELTPAGELAYAAYGDGGAGTGSIRRIVYTPANRSPVATIVTNRTSGPAPLDVSFDGRSSTDPDGDPLSYEWSFGDGTPGSTQPAPAHTYANPGTYIATLTVRDGRGGSDTETVQISAGNTPPVPQVTGDTSYRDGESFQLQGSATDAQQGTIPASGLSWDVKIIHADHVHVLGTFAGRSQLVLDAITDHDADAHYRVVMTATDAGGLSAQATVELFPETTTVRLGSSPAGATLSYGGREFTAPQELETAIGYRTTISAADPFELGGAIFDFTGWSNGGARVQNIVVPEQGAEFTANYSERAEPPAEPPAQQLPPGASPPPVDPGQPPGSPPLPDIRGPALRLLGVDAARGRVRGTVTDPSGVSAVQVALRGRLPDGDCSWWLVRKRMMSVQPRRCDRPRWIDARLASTSGDVAWLLALGRRLGLGTYRVLVRAKDVAGNESTLPLGAGTLVRVRDDRR
jgi:glucose/arabinose dehydrogenase